VLQSCTVPDWKVDGLWEHPTNRAEKVEDGFSLVADETSEKLGNPRKPLNWRNPNVVLFNGFSQGQVVIVVSEKPNHLK
jgi:hypothetical protein